MANLRGLSLSIFSLGDTGAGPGGIVTCENQTWVFPEFFLTKRAYLPLKHPIGFKKHNLKRPSKMKIEV
uniref:Uncharacterized protein n=1 Tax=Ipomoea trifida TaxID=35884 RepID=A0A941_IPOTF|nr:hypothetical protein [Ipomoea trifida]